MNPLRNYRPDPVPADEIGHALDDTAERAERLVAQWRGGAGLTHAEVLRLAEDLLSLHAGLKATQ